MERTLGSAKVGSTVTVIKIEGDGAYKRRIMDMGCLMRLREQINMSETGRELR